MVRKNPETRHLLEQLQHIAQGLGETFAPFCEVVVHDLTHPEHAILSIHNNLSGRVLGDPATQLGLARISDPQFPQLISNYSKQFPDGRQAKSTSIGIKDSNGQFIAALCLNVDLTVFRGLQSVLDQFGSVGENARVKETLDTSGADVIRQRIDEFAARRATTPRLLKAEDRRALMRELTDAGCMEVRRSMKTVAEHLGVSRATVYSDAK
ncbi:MAG: PAS domain-containing protein [Betaproteobacteria bacterium]